MDCPIGFECHTPYAKPIACIEGYYADTINKDACLICPAGWQCPTIFAKVECDPGYYSVAGSVNCYPIPPGMKAGASAKADLPEWCSIDKVSALASTTCINCDANFQCGSDDIATLACTDKKLNSHVGEMSCFPYKFTWPQDPANPTSNTLSNAKLATEVRPGEYNWDGGEITAFNNGNWDCPPGHQCIFPMSQTW